MNWLAIFLVTAPFIGLMLWIAHDLGEMLAEARCTCAKGRVCAKCLAESEAIRGGGGA